MHISVMPEESLKYWLGGNDEGKILPGIYVDATFGEGGHSELFLDLTKKTKNVFLIALDQDERRVKAGRQKMKKEIEADRMEIIKANFKNLEETISSFKTKNLPVRGILFDFGLCTTQFSERRGFSFQEADAPLDMRLDEETELTAETILNEWSVDDLAQIFLSKGDEPAGRKIARAIVKKREEGFRFETVKDLVELLKKTVYKNPFSRIHFATKAFQAIRMTVNEEEESLKRGLKEALQVLVSGGRIVTIAFHSGEDRLAKNFMRQESKDCLCPPELPICVCGHKKRIKILTKKPIAPGLIEARENPRSRSAKLRAARKI